MASGAVSPTRSSISLFSAATGATSASKPRGASSSRQQMGGQLVGAVGGGQAKHRQAHRRRGGDHLLGGVIAGRRYRRQLVDQLADLVDQRAATVAVDHSAVVVLLDEAQRRQQDRVAGLEKRAFAHGVVEHVLRFLGVVGEEPLVEALARLEHRLVAEQHAEELELRNVLAHHHQADGQRRGQEQPGDAPQPGPEHRRDDQRERRDADARRRTGAARARCC